MRDASPPQAEARPQEPNIIRNEAYFGLVFVIILVMDEIRLASNDDKRQLSAIEADADRLFKTAGVNDLPSPASYEDFLAAKCILVAGRPVRGFARIEELDGNAHLEQLSVELRYAGAGLGSRLLDEACEWAKSSGYSAITLTTFKEVPWNGPFYKKHGFVVVDKLSEPLHLLLEHEKTLGLDKIGERIIMQRSLN